MVDKIQGITITFSENIFFAMRMFCCYNGYTGVCAI